MMDTADHNLQKDIEPCTVFLLPFFFQNMYQEESRVKSLVLKGGFVNFHRFKNFRMHCSVAVVFW